MYHKIMSRILTLKKTNTDIEYLDKKMSEILWSQRYYHSILDSEWLLKKSISASGAAANYSFLYILFRILNDFKPTSILEIGLGQTTKLTTQYICNHNANAFLYVVEDDESWLNHYKKHNHTPSDHIILLHKKLHDLSIKNHVTQYYQNLEHDLKDKKFDLILSDGPMGNSHYSRGGIINIIPNCIAQEFIIIFDDYDRQGEKETIELVIQKLNENRIPFKSTVYRGIKHQYLIYSPSFSMLEML